MAEELGLVEVTARYEERRGEAVEALTEVRLALGEHAQLPAALASEIARQPYRERLRAQLAVALYRAGRPVEALRSINDARRLLPDDVGVDPGPELRRLEAAILAHDEATLAWVPPPSPPRRPTRPDRRRRSSRTSERFGRGRRGGPGSGAARPTGEPRRGPRRERRGRHRQVHVAARPAGRGAAPRVRRRLGPMPRVGGRRAVPVVAHRGGGVVARRVVHVDAAGPRAGAGRRTAGDAPRRARPAPRSDRAGGGRDRRPAVGRRRHAVAARVPRSRARAPADPRRRRGAARRIRRAGPRRARLPGRAGAHERSGAPDVDGPRARRRRRVDRGPEPATAPIRRSSPTSPTSAAATRSTSGSCSRCSSPRDASRSSSTVAPRRSPTPCRTWSAGAPPGCRPRRRPC